MSELDLTTLSDDELLKRKRGIERELSALEAKQMAAKILINSLYGATGTPYFRLYDIRMSEGITLCGQVVIRLVVERLNQYLRDTLKDPHGNFVCYADTDSVYLSLKPLVEKYMKGKTEKEIADFLCASEPLLQKQIDKALEDVSKALNCPVPCMSMNREAIANSGIWTAKKRYALSVVDMEGIRYLNPEIKVTGLEIKRSGTPLAVKELLENVLEIALRRDEDEMIEYIRTAKEKFMKLPSDKIAAIKGVSNVVKYDTDEQHSTVPMQSRACVVYNRMLRKLNLTTQYKEFADDSKIKYVYLKMPNPTTENVIAFPNKIPKEFDLEKYVDYDLMFEKVFLTPAKIITDAIGWKTEETFGFDL